MVEKVPISALQLARILTQDDDFIVLEICKDPERELNLENGDHFLSLVFLHQVTDEEGNKKMRFWIPWLPNES